MLPPRPTRADTSSLGDDHVTMVDLEVDVQGLPDGTVEVLDEDEFALRCVEWDSPAVVRAVVPKAADLVGSRLVNDDEPFSAVSGAHTAGLAL